MTYEDSKRQKNGKWKTKNGKMERTELTKRQADHLIVIQVKVVLPRGEVEFLSRRRDLVPSWPDATGPHSGRFGPVVCRKLMKA